MHAFYTLYSYTVTVNTQMDSITGILLAVAAVTVISVIYKNKTRTHHSKTPPSLPWLPIVGSLPFLSGIGTFHIFLTEKTKRLGKVLSTKTLKSVTP